MGAVQDRKRHNYRSQQCFDNFRTEKGKGEKRFGLFGETSDTKDGIGEDVYIHNNYSVKLEQSEFQGFIGFANKFGIIGQRPDDLLKFGQWDGLFDRVFVHGINACEMRSENNRIFASKLQEPIFIFP